MFSSIKAPITIVVTLAISIVTALVLCFAVMSYETLYIKMARNHSASLVNSVAKLISPVLTDMNDVGLSQGRPSQAQGRPSHGRPPHELSFDELPPVIDTILQQHEHVISLRIYDNNYTLLSEKSGSVSYNPTTPLPDDITPQNLSEKALEQQGIIVEYSVIGSTIFPQGYVYLFVDINTPLFQSDKSLLFNVLPFVILIWVLSVLVSLYIINRQFKPLASLTLFTKKVIETKDYALRQEITSKDEIGELGTNINCLLRMIEVELLINHEQNQILLDQQETMTRLANYDSLTGLPNRQFVLDHLKLELARAKRNNEDLVLLFFDLDGFKGINDSLGHETGDLILIEVADRVSLLLREGDLVARLGGDEFLVLPDRDTRGTSIENIAMRLVSAFDDPFELRGLSLTVGVSVGVATAINANYDLSELMSNADLAMYRSKAKGRGSFTVFTPDMVESHKRKLHLANAIEQGLLNDEFRVYYQVKVDNCGKVVGLEALIRWLHPEYGMVMPGEFIPIAEHGGKISAITHWIINKVCIDIPEIKRWLGRRYRVSINLSGHDLRNSHLFDSIYAMFIEHDVNPEYVEFEVTESAYLENFALSNKFFKRMSNMGCAIALDDFGTGYSSLSYLTQISIDTLKIDRQFVQELETSERSRLVTAAIIDLAKRLSLTVCAEGIENEPQWAYLIQHGCDYVQGYMFTKPIPIDELVKTPGQYDVTDPSMLTIAQTQGS